MSDAQRALRSLRDPALPAMPAMFDDRAGEILSAAVAPERTREPCIDVEDEVRIASFLEKGLRAHGFAPSVVANGQTAAAVARDADFDLMILDLGLPDMDGNEVLKQIRDRGQRMPVVILTARQDAHRQGRWSGGRSR